jgi:cold shock CspA family protein
MATTMSGTVVRYDPAHGFGFIRSDTGGRIFFHAGALRESGWIPQHGERVVVKLALGPEGLRARGVQREEAAR